MMRAIAWRVSAILQSCMLSVVIVAKSCSIKFTRLAFTSLMAPMILSSASSSTA